MFNNETTFDPSLYETRSSAPTPPPPQQPTICEEMHNILKTKKKEELKRKRKRIEKDFKSKKMRKIASKALTEKKRRILGEKRRGTNDETLQMLVQSVIDETDPQDAEVLRQEIIEAHAETTAACKKFAEVMAALFEATEPVTKYSGILKRSENRLFGGTHLLQNLANAMRNAVGFCDNASKEQAKTRDRYFSLMARFEALSRSSAQHNSNDLVARKSKKKTKTPMNKTVCARWALQLGTGQVVEMRSANADKPPSRPVESYLSCSMANSNYVPEERLEGQLLIESMERKAANKRARARPVENIIRAQSKAICGVAPGLLTFKNSVPQIEHTSRPSPEIKMI